MATATIPWDTDREAPRAKSVILLVGDGMGQAHRLAGQLVSRGTSGRLAMDRLPIAGLMGTVSADPDTFVTDSAAAATAMATGVKTVNGAVAVDPNGRPVSSILELAKRAGKSAGLITTCQITDATPRLSALTSRTARTRARLPVSTWSRAGPTSSLAGARTSGIPPVSPASSRTTWTRPAASAAGAPPATSWHVPGNWATPASPTKRGCGRLAVPGYSASSPTRSCSGRTRKGAAMPTTRSFPWPT